MFFFFLKASGTKKILAEMTNRFLDINTKEEVRFFNIDITYCFSMYIVQAHGTYISISIVLWTIYSYTYYITNSISPIQFTIFYTFVLNKNLFAPVSCIFNINKIIHMSNNAIYINALATFVIGLQSHMCVLKVVAAFATYSITLVQFHSNNKNWS